jgi:hypothetical protein
LQFKLLSHLKTIPFELIFWVAGLLYLLLSPLAVELPMQLCLFRKIGLDFCPGCGLGESIGWLLRGEFGRSIETHILGPLAVAIIVHRVFQLAKPLFTIVRKDLYHA